jgi:hypothetical protein
MSVIGYLGIHGAADWPEFVSAFRKGLVESIHR